MMLIGQQPQENEREKRQRKSQVYRSMLDHQIEMNHHIRREKTSSKDKDKDKKEKEREKEQFEELPTSSLALSRHHQTPETSHNEPIETFVRDMRDRRDTGRKNKDKNRLFPLLRDKNTFYHGSSRFLKRNEPEEPTREVRHTYTQQIQEEEGEQELDGYNSTCQRIIRELQSISNKPVKFRTKRKVHDKADLIANRRLVEKQNEKHRPSQKGLLAQVQWQGQSTPASFKAVRDPVPVHLPQHNPENRYSQFISADLGSLQHTANEFDESEDKVKQQKVKSSSRLKDESGSAPKNSLSSHSPFSPRNETSKKNGSKGSRYETHSNHIQSRTASHKQEDSHENERGEANRGKEVPTRQFQLPKRQAHQSYSKSAFEQERSQVPKMDQERREMQREKFIKLLRSVKTRGESLYLKMAKPTAEQGVCDD